MSVLRILAALQGQKKTAGVASRRSLIQGTRLLSSALLTAALLAALLASATLLAAALFLALFLFITIALLAAALLSGSRRFDWFIRLTFFFHITFLLFTMVFALRERTFPLFEIVFGVHFGLENLPVSVRSVGA